MKDDCSDDDNGGMSLLMVLLYAVSAFSDLLPNSTTASSPHAMGTSRDAAVVQSLVVLAAGLHDASATADDDW